MTPQPSALPETSLVEALREVAADPWAIAWPKQAPSRLGRWSMQGLGRFLPSWLFPGHLRRQRRVHRLMRQSALFAADWYVARYGPAAGLGRDPLYHFVAQGAARGFLPSPDWHGRSSDEATALAERHGKAGRSAWRYMRDQGGLASDVFAAQGLVPLGPLRPEIFASTVESVLSGAPWAIDLLVVDHAMGGGANRYRNQRLADALGSGDRVALLTYHLTYRRYRLEIPVGDALVAVAADDPAGVARLLRVLAPATVLVNNLASYPDVPGMLDLVRERFAGRVEFPLHDYLAICPSFTLLDDGGRFCGIPGLDRCRTCLSAAQLPLPTRNAARDIDRWRAAWSSLLAASDRVVAFSASSRDLLLRAHPSLAERAIEVRPHKVDYLPAAATAPDRGAPLHIGVVGEISVAKGAAVVAGLARALARRPGGTRLTVIGTVDRAFAAGIDQTGRYRTADLPDLVARAGINLGLVPSIWPETFCYVAEELIALGLPVAAFDLGAPAERLRHYPQGHVLRAETPDDILDELETFWQSLREGGATSSSVAATSARVGS